MYVSTIAGGEQLRHVSGVDEAMPVYTPQPAGQSWQGLQGLPRQHLASSFPKQSGRNGHPGTTSVASHDFPGATGPGTGAFQIQDWKKRMCYCC